MHSLSLFMHSLSRFMHSLFLFMHSLSLFMHSLSLFMHSLSLFMHSLSLFMHSLSLFMHLCLHALFVYFCLYKHIWKAIWRSLPFKKKLCVHQLILCSCTKVCSQVDLQISSRLFLLTVHLNETLDAIGPSRVHVLPLAAGINVLAIVLGIIFLSL